MLLKKNNEDIAALRKQLKLTPSEHPQAKEIIQEQNDKDDMMNIIFQLTGQIKEMEIQMEKLVHEKETVKVPEPPTLIPIVTTTMPSNLAKYLAPKVPLATAVPVISSTTSAAKSSSTTIHPTDEANKLVKAMEEMSLKTSEINKLTKMVENLVNTKKLSQINATTHEEKGIRLNEELKNLQKELTLKEKISYIKKCLWNNVIEAIHDVWPSIQVIF